MRSADEIRNADPTRATPGNTRWEVEDTPWGFRYAALRDSKRDAASRGIRITAFAMPFHCLLADTPHMFVPADDGFTWFYDVRTDRRQPLDRNASNAERGVQVGVDVGPDHRKLRTLENNFMQDRRAMRAREEKWAYSGIAWGKPHQDMAVIESMGPIYDRTKEHLGVQDLGVVRMRQRMLDSVRTFMDSGDVPALAPESNYGSASGGAGTIPIDTAWQSFDGSQLVPARG